MRPFPAGEVALLTSFAAHAAVALENARLFEQARAAVAVAAEANAELRSRNEATERAARAHDRLTDVLLHGGGVVEVADVLAEILGGALSVYDDEGRLLTGADHPPADDAVEQARSSGRSVLAGDAWVAVAAAGDEHLGTLVLRTPESLDLPERRTLERGALVTALVLLFGRTEAEAESRVRGELLSDLVSGRRPRRRPAARAGPPAGRGSRRRALAIAGRERRPRTSRAAGSPRRWPASCTASVGSTRGTSWSSRPGTRVPWATSCRPGSTARRSV